MAIGLLSRFEDLCTSNEHCKLEWLMLDALAMLEQLHDNRLSLTVIIGSINSYGTMSSSNEDQEIEEILEEIHESDLAASKSRRKRILEGSESSLSEDEVKEEADNNSSDDERSARVSSARSLRQASAGARRKEIRNVSDNEDKSIDDMFSEDGENEYRTSKSKRQKTRYLEATNFDGQELDPDENDKKYTRGTIAESDSDEDAYDEYGAHEIEDESDLNNEFNVSGDKANIAEGDTTISLSAARKRKTNKDKRKKLKKAPQIEPFNMKRDLEEGRFNKDGTFIRNEPDPDAQYDAWLKDVKKGDIKLAKQVLERKEEEAQRNFQRRNATKTSDVLRLLIGMLDKHETPLGAIQRLGKLLPHKKISGISKQRQKKQTKEQTEQNITNYAEVELLKQSIEQITNYVGLLMDKGLDDVNDETREALMRIYERETGEVWASGDTEIGNKSNLEYAEDNRQEQAQAPFWLFKWENDEKIYGPYPDSTIKAWKDQGFFSGPQKAYMKPTDDPKGFIACEQLF